jgi:hypothetical protein
MQQVKYRLNPDFVVAEPTPADSFAFFRPDTPKQRQAVIEEMARMWRADGIEQMRATLVGADDDTGYPQGLWLEGWKDRFARQLPFGSPWPDPLSAIWPPLTASADTLPKGQDGEAGLVRSKGSAVAEGQTPKGGHHDQ